MKYYKSVLSGFTIILAAALLCSCNKNIPDSSSQIEQTTPAATTVQTDEPEEDEKALFDGCKMQEAELPEGLDYIQTLQYTNGSVYFSGCVQNNITETSECIFDTKTGKISKTICGVDSTYIDHVLLTDNQTIYIYSDEEYNTIAAAADCATGKITAQTKLDDGVIVKKMIFDEQTSHIIMLTVTGSSENVKSDIKVFDTRLNPVSDIQLGDKLKFEEFERVENITETKEGYYILTYVIDDKIFLSSQMIPDEKQPVYKLYAVDKDMKLKYEIENTYGSIADLFTAPDGNIILVPGKNKETKINVYKLDYTNGNQLQEYELHDVSTIYPPCSDYDILFEKNSDDYLYGLSSESEEPVKIAVYGTDIDSIYSLSSISSSYADMILFSSQVSDDVRPYMFRADTNGRLLDQTAVSETDNDFYAQQTYVSENGDIYCLNSKITEPVSETQAADQTEDTQENYLVEYFICVYSQDGKFKFSRSLGKAADISEPVTVKTILADDEYVYVLMNTENEDMSCWKVMLIDQESMSISSTVIPEGYYSPQILKLSDNTTALSYYSSEQHIIALLEHGLIGKELYTSKISQQDEPFLYSGAGRFDFFYQTNNIFYGWDSKTSENVKLLDLSEESLGIDIQIVCPVSDDTLICAAYDYDDCDSEKLFFLKAR
ncbi:MAG: hypothetical protein Q4F95_05560 [Oscillospiraceae bacterium]|nr:hypothetical protein [Oscillospiraceae bacterium]